MGLLVAGLILFLGVHSVRFFPGLRETLARPLGEGGYKIVYSLVSAAGLALIVYGKYIAHPSTAVWDPPEWGRHLALVAVPAAFVLLVAAYAPSHIRATVRHPMLAGIALWSGAHLLANGESAAMTLFGAFFIWSLIALWSALRREPKPRGTTGWGGDITAVIIGLGAALLILRYHMFLFGVAVVG